MLCGLLTHHQYLGQMNMGGAKDRPDLAQVWENVQDKLEGGEGRHNKYALLGMWTVMKKMMCFARE